MITLAAVPALNAEFTGWSGDVSGRTDRISLTITADLVATASFTPRAEPAPDRGITIAPGENIQTAIDAHPAGTTFLLGAGTHRLQSVRPRSGDVFIGEPDTILNGAKLVTTWQAQGAYWVATGQTQQTRIHSGAGCNADSPGCRYGDDLYLDHVALRQVMSLSAVGPETWYFDYAADLIYMGRDPAGHTMEASVTDNAFSGSATSVTIDDIIFEKYASRAQHAPIEGQASTNWVVRNIESRLNHGSGLRTGDGMQVLNSYFHHNGQQGVGAPVATSSCKGTRLATTTPAASSLTGKAAAQSGH